MGMVCNQQVEEIYCVAAVFSIAEPFEFKNVVAASGNTADRWRVYALNKTFRGMRGDRGKMSVFDDPHFYPSVQAVRFRRIVMRQRLGAAERFHSDTRFRNPFAAEIVSDGLHALL